MNRYVTLVPIAVLILAGTGIVSQAYAAFTITMETDKNIYDHSSVITVTGQVKPIDPQSSDVSIQVFAPNGNLATVAQVTPSLDGNFSVTINTASLKSDGTYMIKAQYVGTEITVSVDGTFAVIVDNQRMLDFTQVGNTLTIPCVAGTEKIEIHGSWAIPEFGVIAAMILAVAIVSIIVITAKTRLSLVPRY